MSSILCAYLADNQLNWPLPMTTPDTDTDAKFFFMTISISGVVYLPYWQVISVLLGHCNTRIIYTTLYTGYLLSF